MVYETASIREMAKQLRNEGHGVTENTLRTWVRQGVIPAAYVGKKAYINRSSVIAILKNGTPRPTAEETTGKIRRVG